MSELNEAVFELAKVSISFYGLILAALGLLTYVFYVVNLKPFFDRQKKQEEDLHNLEKTLSSKLLEIEKLQDKISESIDSQDKKIEEIRSDNKSRQDEIENSLKSDIYELESDFYEKQGLVKKSVISMISAIGYVLKTSIGHILIDYKVSRLNRLFDKAVDAHDADVWGYGSQNHENLKKLLDKVEGYDEVKQQLLEKSLSIVKE